MLRYFTSYIYKKIREIVPCVNAPGSPHLSLCPLPQKIRLYRSVCDDFSSGSKGTCTCTCETRPVSAKSNSQPNSASLIRTAARKEAYRIQHDAAEAAAAAAAAAGDGGKKEDTAAPSTSSAESDEMTGSKQIVEVPHDLDESLSPTNSELASDMWETQQLLNGCADRTF